MRRSRGVDDQSLCITDIRQVTRKPERIDNLACHKRVLRYDTETQNTTELSLSQVLLRQFVATVRLETDVRYPLDFGVLLEVLCER